jgi:large subunit ribosomal protein L24
MKIRKGDTVEIISGRLEDKGRRGEGITVMAEHRRVVVQGVNMRVKHKRQTQTQSGRQIKPGRIQFEAPIDISHVMLVCPKCGKPARVGIQRDDAGAHRVCKNCDQLVD